MKKYFILIFLLYSFYNLTSQSIWDDIDKGSLDKVKNSIEKIGIDISAQDNNGYSLLYRAIKADQMQIVSYLLEKNIKIDGNSIILTIQEHRYEVMKILLNKGFDFYMIITGEEYVDTSESAETRRFEKSSKAIFNRDTEYVEYLRKYDPDFKKKKWENHIIDYAQRKEPIYGILSQEFINHVKILRLLMDKNNSLEKKLLITNPNINTYIIIGNLEEVKNRLKKGETLSEYSFPYIFILDEESILNYFYDIEFVNDDNFEKLFEQAQNYNAEKCISLMIRKKNDVENMYKKAVGNNNLIITNIIKEEYPDLVLSIDEKIENEKRIQEEKAKQEALELKIQKEKENEEKRIRLEEIKNQNEDTKYKKSLYRKGIITGAVFCGISLASIMAGVTCGTYYFILGTNNTALGIASASLLGSSVLFFTIGFPILYNFGLKYKRLPKIISASIELGYYKDGLLICLSTKL